MSVTKFRDEQGRARASLAIAIERIGNIAEGRSPRWVHVGMLFGFGSGSAHRLCKEVGADPDEEVGTNKCDGCGLVEAP